MSTQPTDTKMSDGQVIAIIVGAIFALVILGGIAGGGSSSTPTPAEPTAWCKSTATMYDGSNDDVMRYVHECRGR